MPTKNQMMTVLYTLIVLAAVNKVDALKPVRGIVF